MKMKAMNYFQKFPLIGMSSANLNVKIHTLLVSITSSNEHQPNVTNLDFEILYFFQIPRQQWITRH